MFDIRKIDDKLYSLESHEGEVSQVAWSPHEDPILASAASDRKIIVWDLREIGKEQTPDDAEDGPPEVLVSANTYTFFSFSLISKYIVCSQWTYSQNKRF